MLERKPELSTRRKIMNMLKTKPGQGVAPIAESLGLTEMAVRRHLITLQNDGLVRTELVRQGMGRPLRIYFLTKSAEHEFPNNYHRLALELLNELEADNRDHVTKLFQRRKNRLHDQYSIRMEGKSLAERVIELTSIQNTGGYMAEWKRLENGDYVIDEFNCPISQVAGVYEEACECELQLFQSLLQAPVKRTECLAKQGRKCSYVIQQTAK